jgi:hypothetical protein
MKLDTQNMAKTSVKLPASETCGDVCATECLVNGQKVLVVTVYVSPNTPSNNWKYLTFCNLAGYSPKVYKMFNILERIGCEDMPVILAGDFNINMKYNYNVELIDFMKDTLEFEVLSDLSQGTTSLILASIWSLVEMWTIYPA